MNLKGDVLVTLQKFGMLDYLYHMASTMLPSGKLLECRSLYLRGSNVAVAAYDIHMPKCGSVLQP